MPALSDRSPKAMGSSSSDVCLEVIMVWDVKLALVACRLVVVDIFT